VLLTYFTYFALAIFDTPSFAAPCTVTDTRATMDVDISSVNRALYSSKFKEKGGSDTL